jgi:ribosomal protein S27AE
MGNLREYSCPDCGYTAKVSGGKDRGFIAFTETVECLDCHNLADVEIGKVVDETPENEEVIQPVHSRCPSCGSFNLKPWDGKTCPQCGGTMIKGDVTILWD